MSITTPMHHFAARANRTPTALILMGRAHADELDSASEHGDAAWLDLWDDQQCIGTVFLDGKPDPAAVLAQLAAAGLDLEMEDAIDIAGPPYVHGWRPKPNSDLDRSEAPRRADG